MEPERLAVLGAASLRYAPTICAGLAIYFGEQPLEVRFWDADPERLDLFDRFARYLFELNKTPHLLMSTEDPHEAIFGSDRIVIALDDHGAERFLPDATSVTVVEALRLQFPDGAKVLDLRDDLAIPEPTEEEVRALPHDIMRYLRGDDWAYGFLREQAESPVKLWLQAGQR